MRVKNADLSEKQLKDYLMAFLSVKEMPQDKLMPVLNKYKKSEGDEKEEIQKKIIESHLKMVISIANRYRGAGLSFAGLITHGNTGLISAVKKWDAVDNESFTNYLVWNVEGAILEALIRAKKEARMKG